jgi:hydrogenase-4 component B
MQELASKLLVGALIGYSSGAIGAVLLARHDRAANLVAFGATILGSAAALLASFITLLGGPEFQFELFPSPIPLLHVAVQFDALSAFFTMIVSLLGLAIALYSLGYIRGFYGRKNVGALGFFFNALLLATTLVVCADNAFFFLLVWELMTLCGYCLVSFEHEDSETRRAGILYFVMSHIGTGCIMLGFLLLFQGTGQLEFARLHELGPGLAPGLRNAAFLLFLAGFGIKAGIVPLHIWLPAAHPVAPSNVSAFLSGVMIKMGIYGMARVWFDFLPAAAGPPLWWGVLVLTIGTASALLGVLYALMEHDLKRLLAYHSVENIGIILIGFGAALLFLAAHQPALAALALIAGLYHTINHATFKGLLFLGAGAVLHATHTRNMEELGGLIRRMPKTAFFFLVGAVAIAGLPPLNGFVSEWLTYQSLLRGFNTSQDLSRLLFPISGSLLALTAALAAACFVKAFGITFLAQSRSDHVRQAHEASPTMLAGMGLLAAICFGLGLFPTAFLKVFDPVTSQLLGQSLSAQLATTDGLALAPFSATAGSVSPIGIAALLLVLAPLPVVLCWIGCRGRKTKVGPTWDCGLRGLTPRMEYTATAFSKPLQMIFRALFRPRREMQADYEFSRYFTRTIRFEVHIEPIFERWIYQPFHNSVLKLSKRIRALQTGSIHAYLAYVFVTLLALLLLVQWL